MIAATLHDATQQFPQEPIVIGVPVKREQLTEVAALLEACTFELRAAAKQMSASDIDEIDLTTYVTMTRGVRSLQQMTREAILRAKERRTKKQ